MVNIFLTAENAEVAENNKIFQNAKFMLS